VSPAIAVLTAWLVFGGSHLLLSAPPLRASLSNKLGASRFVVFYTLITAVSLSLLIVHRTGCALDSWRNCPDRRCARYRRHCELFALTYGSTGPKMARVE
jgi:hypothetical protein